MPTVGRSCLLNEYRAQRPTWTKDLPSVSLRLPVVWEQSLEDLTWPQSSGIVRLSRGYSHRYTQGKKQDPLVI